MTDSLDSTQREKTSENLKKSGNGVRELFQSQGVFLSIQVPGASKVQVRWLQNIQQMRRQSTLVFVIASLACGNGNALSFTSPAGTVQRRPSTAWNSRSRSMTTRLASSSKEDDIAEVEKKLQRLREVAELEEKLQQLKEEAEQDEVKDQVREVNVGQITSETDPNVTDEPFAEMLTEQWKESDPSQNDGTLVKTVAGLVGTVAVVAALSLFAQLPVGQEDLSRYQAGKASISIDLGDMNGAKESN